MRYGPLDRFQTGVVTPVSALRTAQSCGVGEFADLVELGHWCAEVGVDLIQILPVTDTGDDPSPYAGRSARALHPIYLRLQDVEGAEPWRQELEAFGHAHDRGDLDYDAVLAFKLDILSRVQTARADEVAEIAGAWSQTHTWVREYAAFQVLKEESGGAPWWEWDTELGVEDIWAASPERAEFHAYLQYELDRQLRAAASRLEAMGVRLKGDLPILVAEDSVDVWSLPHAFRRDVAAGAPPDMFATAGQNWSFPAYRWEQPDCIRWWEERLVHTARHFHAFRIDHVLGFFRLWEIPRAYEAGMLGSFRPAVPVSVDRLADAGFDAAAIQRMLAPEGKPRPLPDERELLALEDPTARDEQLQRFWDRILVRHDDVLSFRWEFETTGQFLKLPEPAQEQLSALYRDIAERQDTLWGETGRRRLTRLVAATDMLPCAEDLGSEADCVPPVLEELGLLRLCVDRWWRESDAADAAFLHPDAYPRLSVATASTHDTSTLRGWWREDVQAREALRARLDRPGPLPDDLDREWMLAILERQLQANSILATIGLWELSELDPALRPATPDAQRINVPGTPSRRNWGVRMPIPVEELCGRDAINTPLRQMIARRRSRAL